MMKKAKGLRVGTVGRPVGLSASCLLEWSPISLSSTSSKPSRAPPSLLLIIMPDNGRDHQTTRPELVPLPTSTANAPRLTSNEKSAAVVTTTNTMPRASIASVPSDPDAGHQTSDDDDAQLNRGPITGISHRATFNDANGELVHGPPPLHFEWSPMILIAYILFVMFCNLGACL